MQPSHPPDARHLRPVKAPRWLTAPLLALGLSTGALAQTFEPCTTPDPTSPTPTDLNYRVTTAVSIPVVFHVLYKNDGTGNHTDATLQLQVDVLNDAFEDAGVEFYIIGVDRVRDEVWFSDLRSDERFAEISGALRVDTRRVLNIYTGYPENSLGSGTIPNEGELTYDGVRLRYHMLPAPHAWDSEAKDPEYPDPDPEPYATPDGGVGLHEVGHWLNLYHTFRGPSPLFGCQPQAQCATNGDYVCDTPPQEYSRNRGYNCGVLNTCPQQPGNDPIDNHMSYSGDYCRTRFTAGQYERMNAAIGQFRPDLIPGGPIEYDRNLVVGANRTLTWAGGPDGVTLAFAPGYGIQVSGAMSATDLTFTAKNPAQGWTGIRYDPGSGGTIASSIVERVSGSGRATAAVDIRGASPRIEDSQIRDAVPGSAVTGVRITGAAAFPYLLRNTIRLMTDDGVVLDSRARAHLVRNTIRDNVGDGLVAGYLTEAFLSAEAVSGAPRGNVFEDNGGYGVYATLAARVTYAGPPSGEPLYADGYNTVIESGQAGNAARSGATLAAGNTQSQGRNRFLANSGPEAAADGASTRVYVRCDWWGGPPPFDLEVTNGAVLDASRWLEQDPYVVPYTPCVDGSGSFSGGGGAALRDGGGWASLLGSDGGIGTDTLAGGPREWLLSAAEAEEPADAFALLQQVVGEAPDTDEAEAALGEVGWLHTREDAPPGALGFLEAHAAGAHEGLRSAARHALVGALHATDDAPGALAVADTLAAADTTGAGGPEGGTAAADAVFGHLALVYLHAEAGQLAEAAGALAAVEALAPGSAEAALARAHLETLDPEGFYVGRLSASGPSATGPAAPALRADEAFRLGPAVPNPARATVVVPFVLGAPSRVRLVLADALGREVAVVADGAFGAGPHALTLDLAGRAAGVYVVRAVASPERGGPLARSLRLTVLR